VALGEYRRNLTVLPREVGMGLLDKAMRTANELAGKAETMMNQAGAGTGMPGGSSALYEELGRLVHDEHRGRPVDAARRGDLLRRLDQQEEQASSAPPPPGAPPPPPPPPSSF
jgi:hypothetical protein